MQEITSFVAGIPPWAGSVPLWLIFFGFAGVVVKTWPIIQKNLMDNETIKRGENSKRIDQLELALRACEKECRDRETELTEEIDLLKTRINNEAWQRVQSEISLVRTLINVVPSTDLKVILEALQRRSNAMPAAATEIGGPVSDAKHEGGK